MSVGEWRKYIPPYITRNPINIKTNAKVRILFILLEYIEYFAIVSPLQKNYTIIIEIEKLITREKCRNLSENKEGVFIYLSKILGY
jgi:hypothetical protein